MNPYEMLKDEVLDLPAEFQAVVMAAGKGSRMQDVTSACFKPLLPVGNFPLVWYPIDMLERAGFNEVIVVVLDSQYDDIKLALRDVHEVQIKLDFVVLEEDKCLGTAETLRIITDRIKRDLLVVSCDLISDVKLQQVANVHRSNDASVTMMLTPLMAPFLAATPPGIKAEKKKALKAQDKLTPVHVPGAKEPDRDKDVIALDSSGMRVLYNKPLADFREKDMFGWQFPKRQRFPNTTMSFKLTDCHLYFMKKWVLNYICDKTIPDAKNITSIKSDLIPHLVKSQFLKPEVTEKDEDEFRVKAPVKTILDYAAPSEEEKLFAQLSLSKKDEENGIKVCAFQQTDGFVVRVNTLGTYCEANRQIHSYFASERVGMKVDDVHPGATLKDKTTVVKQSCLVGEGTTIGSKSVIDKSVVGRHCVIGDNVKIIRSVVMDHVRIGDGCDIQGSLICTRATIEQRGDIKESVIGNHQKLQPKCRLRNEVLCPQSGMIEL